MKESILKPFDRERAIRAWTGLQERIAVGAYDERGADGTYGEDGVEEELDELEARAAREGLAFCWDGNAWTLAPMSEEDQEAP